MLQVGGGASWCDCFTHPPPHTPLCFTVVVFITFSFFWSISADQSRILTVRHRASFQTRAVSPSTVSSPPPSLFESFISPFDLKKLQLWLLGFCGCVERPEVVSLFCPPVV